MQTVDEMCALIRAEAEGKVIEANGGEGWYARSQNLRGTWDFTAKQYRIKPEPREFVLERHKKPACDTHYWEVSDPTRTSLGALEVIRVREVIGESEK